MNEPIGMGALWASFHLLRVMVNRGLISPNEVDEIYGSMLEGVQSGEPAIAAIIEAQFEGPVSEIRQTAHERWIGKGKSNPQ